METEALCLRPSEPNWEDETFVTQLGTKKRFRLLRIEPADKFSDPLCGTLEQFQLPMLDKDAPRYWFLTYDTTQVVSSDRLKIELASSQNGRQVKEKIPLSDNLGQALQYLRTKSGPGLSIHVWVERLCHTTAGIPMSVIPGGAIPVEEKATIPSIIQRADATIAWLGLGPPPAAIASDKKRIRWHNETQWEVGHSKDMALMNVEPDLSRLKDHDQQRQAFETFSESRANDWPVFSNAFVRKNLLWKHFPSLLALRISRLVMFIQGGFACPDYRLSSLRFEGSNVVPPKILPTLRLATRLLPTPASPPLTPGQASELLHLLPGENERIRQSHLHDSVRSVLADRLQDWMERSYNTHNIHNTERLIPWFVLWTRHLQRTVTEKDNAVDEKMRERLMTYFVRDAAVAQDVWTTRIGATSRINPDSTSLCGKGYIASQVQHVGISHKAFCSAPKVTGLGIWDREHPSDSHGEKLSRASTQSAALRYTKLSLNYTQNDLEFLQPFRQSSWPKEEFLPQYVAAWARDHRVPEESLVAKDEPQTIPLAHDIPFRSLYSTQAYSTASPVYFSGTNGCIGLAPAGTKLEDYIVKFRGCDAALIFRPVKERPGIWLAIGRADVVMPGEPLSRQEIIETPNISDRSESGVNVCMA
ncbi:hypothetical protein CPLU01_12064 [Colletotrichum plurivorum]|uniref:Uncharacterized protein n=1 Tax=Colletotrichum plurivorum TaxID=2175906 RepID=A0A8H6K093_9PEZI|nr:hypothetical protein CPLU01_12064 [Colletotrichum plurivorum]